MKRGRPELPPQQKRTIRKEVRLSNAEYDRICVTALRLRMDFSQFMRFMALPEMASAISVRIKNTELI